jgi:hypothetical protein
MIQFLKVDKSRTFQFIVLKENLNELMKYYFENKF